MKRQRRSRRTPFIAQWKEIKKERKGKRAIGKETRCKKQETTWRRTTESTG